MKERVKEIMMWAFSIPVTYNGIDTLVHGATTLIGFITAICGGGMAVCGFIWWIRRLQRQKIKIQMEELELEKLQRNIEPDEDI